MPHLITKSVFADYTILVLNKEFGVEHSTLINNHYVLLSAVPILPKPSLFFASSIFKSVLDSGSLSSA